MALDQVDVDDENYGKEKNMSFLDHLEELRWNIIRSVIAIIVGFIGSFLFPDFIFDTVILGPKRVDFPTYQLLCFISQNIGIGATFCVEVIDLPLQNTVVMGIFLTHLKISFVAGLIIAFPYIIYEIWKFVSPALNKGEKKHARGIIFFCSLLFFMGVSFGYFVIIPFCVNFFANYNVIGGIQNMPRLDSYISFVTSIVLAAGFMFEMPIFAYFFSKIGILTPQLLKNYRKHAVVSMLLISALVTPPDVFSQILLSLPLYVLYETSILISARVNKKYEEEYG